MKMSKNNLNALDLIEISCKYFILGDLSLFILLASSSGRDKRHP